MWLDQTLIQREKATERVVGWSWEATRKRGVTIFGKGEVGNIVGAFMK